MRAFNCKNRKVVCILPPEEGYSSAVVIFYLNCSVSGFVYV